MKIDEDFSFWENADSGISEWLPACREIKLLVLWAEMMHLKDSYGSSHDKNSHQDLEDIGPFVLRYLYNGSCEKGTGISISSPS